MKKLVQINVVCNGSTGKIMCNLAKEAKDSGFDSYCFYGRGLPNKGVRCIRIGNKLSVYFHVLLARLGFNGHGSYFATKKMVKKLREINPDVIHLHNIHGYYINLKVLFKYLKKEYTGKIVWTLHDCWAFTGHCSHFTIAKCNKWKNECKKCPQLHSYPIEWIDTSNKEYKMKKKVFTGLNNLTIVTPSDWLKGLVTQSFLKEYKVEVINNSINYDVFKPTYDENIYNKYGIPKNKKIILGVANVWNERKGLNVFFDLSKIIDNNYQIVLVGTQTNNKLEFNHNIITVPKTDNANDLAKIYSISEVLFNPTFEDNYPTVNLEAKACGLPVICFDTGGCKEQVPEECLLDSNASIDEIYLKLKSVSKRFSKKILGKTNEDFIAKYIAIYNNNLTVKSRINVLMVCSSLNNGGVEQIVYNIYKNINKDKFNLHFITFEPKEGTIEKLLGNNVIHISPVRDGLFKHYKELNEIISGKSFDIIHSHIGIYSFICLFVAWKNGVKIRICHSHNFQKEMSIGFKIKKNIYQKMDNLLATNYLACGRDAGIWQFGKKNVDRNKVFFLNNAIELNKFKYCPNIRQKIRNQLGVKERFVIGHIGRFTYEKNHKFIIKVAEKLKKTNSNFVFILIGDGPEFSNIRSLILQKELNDVIILLGARNNVNELINSFDIFILPSLFEAFPITLIEAQANGLQCIVSNKVTNEAKINSNFHFCAIDDNSVLKWVELINDAIENNSNDSRKCSKGINKFSINNMVDKLEKFYEKVVRGI